MALASLKLTVTTPPSPYVVSIPPVAAREVVVDAATASMVTTTTASSRARTRPSFAHTAVHPRNRTVCCTSRGDRSTVGFWGGSPGPLWLVIGHNRSVVYDDGSVTDALAVQFVNGDFNIKFVRAGHGWPLAAASEANATGRRVWWLWLTGGGSPPKGSWLRSSRDPYSTWRIGDEINPTGARCVRAARPRSR